MTTINLKGIAALDITGVSAPSVSNGVAAFTVSGGGGGTVTTTGSPASGNMTKFSGSSSITSGDLSGDVATSGTLATTIQANAVTTSKINNAAVTEAKIGLSNNTTNNVSITAHGFAPLLPNDATRYLDGTGLYSTPPGAITLTVARPVLGLIAPAGVASTSWSGNCFTGAFTGTAAALRGGTTTPVGISYTSSSVATSSASAAAESVAANDTSLGNMSFFEAEVLLPSTASIRVWIGLSDTVTNSGVGNLRSDTPNGNTVAFRYSTAAGDTKWQCVTSTSNVNFTANPQTGTNLDTNRHTFRIAYDGTNALFYIDGTLVGTQNTNLPATSVLMNFFVVCDNVGAANAKAFNLYYMITQPK